MKVKHIFVSASLVLILGTQDALGLSCGETIRQTTTLTADLNCPGHGVVIDGDNVVLDLGGHTLRGPGRGGWVWPERALSSVGIRIAGKKNVTIRNGTITNFATGILLEDAQQVNILRVNTLSNHYGIYLFRGRRNLLSGVTVSTNVYGVHLQESPENHMTRSLIFDSRHGSPAGYGINLYSSDRNTVNENRIESNRSQGIWIIDSRYNIIYRNNLIRNHTNAVDETGANYWHHPQRREGNYWSDYKGPGPYPIGGLAGALDPYPVLKEIPLGR